MNRIYSGSIRFDFKLKGRQDSQDLQDPKLKDPTVTNTDRFYSVYPVNPVLSQEERNNWSRTKGRQDEQDLQDSKSAGSHRHEHRQVLSC
jgi:hypothetical protein